MQVDLPGGRRGPRRWCSTRTELVSIPTDTAPLDGAYYTPEGRDPVGGVLLMHGNTMNFYTGAPRFLPPRLVELGYACLAFNRRGHDILTTRNSRAAEGGALQTAAEGRADNAYAAGWLAERGCDRPVVIGHSNGGTLAARFAADHPHITGLVLLSAHVGGRDIVRLSCDAGQLAADRMEEALAQARRLVAEGEADQLMLLPGWWYAITAGSLLDRLDNTPDLRDAVSAIACPTLFVRGDREPPAIYPAEEFAQLAGGRCDVAIVSACDHFYDGREDAVAGIVTKWLARLGTPS